MGRGRGRPPRPDRDTPAQGAVIALNPARVGHRYPVYTYEVSREKVREYATAAGFDDPAYTADAAEVAPEQIVVPPTFPACFTLGGRAGAVLDDPELGAHPNLVHGGQEYVFHRPLRVGDTLACTPWIADIRSRGRMELLTLRVDCVDAASGEPVLDSSGTLIFLTGDPA